MLSMTAAAGDEGGEDRREGGRVGTELTVAVYVVVGGGLGLIGDEAGDDCDGEDVDVEEEVVNHHGPAGWRGHWIVSWDPARCQ